VWQGENLGQGDAVHLSSTLLHELNNILEDMKNTPSFFYPTQRWSSCCQAIIEDLETKGIETFKSHKSALSYYVHHYAQDLYLFQPEVFESICAALKEVQLDIDSAYRKVATGSLKTRDDYRLFLAADTPRKVPILSGVSEDLYGEPLAKFTHEGKFFSVTMLNYLRQLAFLKRSIDTEKIFHVLEVGGGYGSLGEILLKSDPNRYFYVNIDIPPVSYVAGNYLKKIFGKRMVADYMDTKDLEIIDIDELKKKYRAVVLCPWQLPKIKGTFELFVNTTAFNGMKPEMVEYYAKYIDLQVTDYMLLKKNIVGKDPAKDEEAIRRADQDNSTLFPNFSLVDSDAYLFGQVFNGHKSYAMVYERTAAHS